MYRNFQFGYIYTVYQVRIKEQLVEVIMKNADIRNSSRELHICINAVVWVLKSSHQVVLPHSLLMYQK
ncbi:IS1-like element transposase [Candidatus Enterovibrio escicola]|uniref:IS1-like element transposase n=1 Tax=Candidatus Enterovibrio escicola TaxID=1927127 RepID=UPI001237ADDF